MATLDQPNHTTLEVSVFGPGYGESVVIHLGNGEWVVVDSCLNDSRNDPVSIDYLEKIGVDVSNQVKLVVATHWHADHIRGLAKLFHSAKKAKFACSQALRNPEFTNLLAACDRVQLVHRDSSGKEFSEIIREINLRKERGKRTAAGPDFWMVEGLPLIPPDPGKRAGITAVSPSSQTVTDAKVHFSKLMPNHGDQIKRFGKSSPNDFSAAMLVHHGETSVLLGADLETGDDELRGWNAVLASENIPSVRSMAFKVAHHGSENGDHDGIWSDLLSPDPFAFVTPFAKGPKPLPTEVDIERLKNRARRICCTAWPPTEKPKSRSKAVQRTIKEMTTFHTSVRRRVGQIRFRVELSGNGELAIEHFNGALDL